MCRLNVFMVLSGENTVIFRIRRKKVVMRGSKGAAGCNAEFVADVKFDETDPG